MTSMKFVIKLFLLTAVFTAITAKAQTVPDAHEGPFSIYAGGFGSFVHPQYPPSDFIYGVGAFTDIKFRKWVQIEAEASWLRFNTSSSVQGAYQDYYSVGPKVPIRRFGKFDTYGKFLITDTKINYANGYGYGHFLDYTFGGGADMKLSKHLRLRAADFEYHYVNSSNTLNKNIQPYGVSVGLAYRAY
jgi:hypothetical protein